MKCDRTLTSPDRTLNKTLKLPLQKEQVIIFCIVASLKPMPTHSPDFILGQKIAGKLAYHARLSISFRKSVRGSVTADVSQPELSKKLQVEALGESNVLRRCSR